MTAACALLGLAGVLLGSSCGGKELRCFSDERCEPCPGHCLEDGAWDAVGSVYQDIVWVGELGEEPTCEEYGLVHLEDLWLELQDDPSCPPCRCERTDCTNRSVRFRSSASSCEEADDSEGTTYMSSPWDACEPLGEDGTSTSVTVPWYDVLPACTSREDLYQPRETWKRKARLCRAMQPREYSCGDLPNYPMCLLDHRILDNFRLCVSRAVPPSGPDEGVMEPLCPSEFPERLDMYKSLAGCGTCDCGFDGDPCSMEFSFYRDQACSDLVVTQTLTTESVCTDLAEPVAIGGVKLHVLAEGHGDCTNHGRVGIAEGEKIKPTWGQTFCCKPAGS
ncbi:hypothetical protein WMF39_37165 [Sorangium sp. So ce1504]|uniref:hypothetical protein n=1 Tax=Sorangium sp. So ce1504 TaxID=3133337 RepID=UPI003F62A0EF